MHEFIFLDVLNKMNVITKTLQLADGRTITIETGKVAKQTDGAVMLKMNNTVLLATVCAAKDAVPGTDFMPLQVDYREQYSAAGRFPGGFTKREGSRGPCASSTFPWQLSRRSFR